MKKTYIVCMLFFIICKVNAQEPYTNYQKMKIGVFADTMTVEGYLYSDEGGGYGHSVFYFDTLGVDSTNWYKLYEKNNAYFEVPYFIVKYEENFPLRNTNLIFDDYDREFKRLEVKYIGKYLTRVKIKGLAAFMTINNNFLEYECVFQPGIESGYEQNPNPIKFLKKSSPNTFIPCIAFVVDENKYPCDYDPTKCEGYKAPKKKRKFFNWLW